VLIVPKPIACLSGGGPPIVDPGDPSLVELYCPLGRQTLSDDAVVNANEDDERQEREAGRPGANAASPPDDKSRKARQEHHQAELAVALIGPCQPRGFGLATGESPLVLLFRRGHCGHCLSNSIRNAHKIVYFGGRSICYGTNLLRTRLK
jgi:hypothetical protein